MSIPWNAIAERTPAAPPSACADRVIVRRFDPAIDGYARLTPMLHRAFARLGAMELNCTCVDQDEDVTRRRAEAGECYVAVAAASARRLRGPIAAGGFRFAPLTRRVAFT